MRRTLCLLFFTHLFTRLLFVNFEGVFNNYSLQNDSFWLVNLADESLKGNFNFDIGRFIASPLFPFVCGSFKWMFNLHWQFYLVLFQVLISVVSGLYIYKIAYLIFDDKKIALFSSLLFAFFPMTLWYVHTFSQESIFESLLIFTVYYLLASLKSGRSTDTIKAAIFFSLTYLTKSHILLFSLFIPLIYFHCFRFSMMTVKMIFIFAIIAALFSLPYGIYNYKVNGSYVVSSNGAGYQFYLGNTEAGYTSIVSVPEKKSADFLKMQDINENAGYFNSSVGLYKTIMGQSQQIKQKRFFAEALNWIKSHPLKIVSLKVYDAFFFIIPGVSFRHYDFAIWIVTFIICLPVYFAGYISIYQLCKLNFAIHSWIFYLFLSMLLFSIIWYVQNRFRTITLEPFYVIYASFYLYHFFEKFYLGKRIISFLDMMFLKFLQGIQVKKMIFG